MSFLRSTKWSFSIRIARSSPPSSLFKPLSSALRDADLPPCDIFWTPFLVRPDDDGEHPPPTIEISLSCGRLGTDRLMERGLSPLIIPCFPSYALRCRFDPLTEILIFSLALLFLGPPKSFRQTATFFSFLRPFCRV